ncbi:alkaline phosphatase family protein [Ruegeria lacuscaerulensis]|uniref:alkaline phosphatase family protein n=1 Tax=Ruegeria lacuscaerulensis TaxID=55218 RepID=UPI00147CDE16|nr:alkaline phosphatase family protein [Ruegeria lacuscaerulensis]
MRISLMASAVLCLTAVNPVNAEDAPRLVLQLTVDALRGDLPTKYLDNLGEGGLRHLLETGVHYVDAHHCHANTETVVGHATLATGATPAVHGMIGNVWFDRSLDRVVYNVEDDTAPLLDEAAGVNEDIEIDPTQAAAGTDGRSPRAMLVTTISDELSASTAGAAKVFGVSIKDRGAITMAGQSGKAFWFSKSANRFVTSSYYHDAYPDWVTAWNDQAPTAFYQGATWELMHPREAYIFGDRDDQPWETDVAGFGITFPHYYSVSQTSFDPLDNPYFTTFLTLSPAGDELTAQFAKHLIDAEAIGKDDVTDYLAISFSSVDYVNHVFGPSSLEAEDTIYRLDQTLSDLLAFIDERIGLENVLIVLSADHGTTDAPGYLESVGIQTGLVAPDTWDPTEQITLLKQRFEITGPLLAGYAHPYLNIDPEVLALPDIDLNALEAAIAEELLSFPDVAFAIPATAIEANQLPDTEIMKLIRNNHNPARSGNIYVVFKPGWFIADFDGLSVTSTHGSPWRGDTHVPILFSGPGIEPQRVARRVCTTSIASTLSALLSTARPNGASGEVLQEVVR